MTIFGLKLMVKSGQEKIFWNSMCPFRVAATVQKKLPRKAELAESHFSFKYRSMLHDPILIQVSLTW